MKKRILAGFLSLVMLLSLLPATALAAGTESTPTFQANGYTAKAFTDQVKADNENQATNGKAQVCALWKGEDGKYYLAVANGHE